MGTRYEDQPPEAWAPPDSLDPTPVWRQWILIGAFLLGALVLVGAVAYLALAVQLATPPAVVPGGRVVLARGDVPVVGAPAKRYGPPLVSEEAAFWIAQPATGRFVAVRAAAAPPATAFAVPGDPSGAGRLPFDRYLVSVEGEKVVVNTSRVIGATEKVPAPSDPTFR
ncbi:MAG: hypothetical protein M3O91_07000 [Chloroflexota bacterium]|nr:hypothetical protein [Chloroflexota bacterium]